MPLISVSLLSANFTKLGEEVQAINATDADWLHLDIMDGRFVPNISFGPYVIKAIRPYSSLPFDVHLMVIEPEKYLATFASVGANIITIHAEATNHLVRTIQQIKELGKKAGVALNPGTDETVLRYVLDIIDHVLIMTVNPGFAGQTFLNTQLRKITRVRTMIAEVGRDITLAVDGGINMITGQQALAAGANVLVAGSHIFHSALPYDVTIKKLRK